MSTPGHTPGHVSLFGPPTGSSSPAMRWSTYASTVIDAAFTEVVGTLAD
jgi:glyoxylase-like metal-dependent hydrolase (beta-lactamase superfamily II)